MDPVTHDDSASSCHESAPLRWTTAECDRHVLLSFEIAGPGGLLAPACLERILLPIEVRGKEHLGVVFSGRGPIWLYGHLVHLAHPHAWIAVHDPRLNGAVVICRHRPDSPALGSVVTT